jgi:hypothetical protein
MSSPDKVECVGTLLLHSSDLQEPLSSTRPQASDECVGSLLVHQSDMQELSQEMEPKREMNLQKRVSAGTLLVSSSDLRSEPAREESPKGSLRRRITDRLNSPAPKDEEADTWAD